MITSLKSKHFFYVSKHLCCQVNTVKVTGSFTKALGKTQKKSIFFPEKYFPHIYTKLSTDNRFLQQKVVTELFLEESGAVEFS